MVLKRFKQEDFNEFIIEQDIVGFFEQPIKLKSGRLSNWYVNWRTVAEDAFLFNRLVNYVIAYVDDLGLEPVSFYGVPEGATKLGVITQFVWARRQPDFSEGKYPLPMGRAKPKDHGAPKDMYFVGKPCGKTIVLEDVTTRGESLLATLDTLKAAKVDVIATIGLTNRNELGDDGKSVKEKVEERGIPYYAMSNALELLPEIIERVRPEGEMVKLVEEYFDKYGIKKISLKS